MIDANVSGSTFGYLPVLEQMFIYFRKLLPQKGNFQEGDSILSQMESTTTHTVSFGCGPIIKSRQFKHRP